MTLDNMLLSMEQDYYYSYHNKYSKEAISMIFYSYQYCLNQYHVLDKPIPLITMRKLENTFTKK
jgi:hypothetical protein